MSDTEQPPAADARAPTPEERRRVLEFLVRVMPDETVAAWLDEFHLGFAERLRRSRR